jgi:hypothetical protein
MALSYFPVGLVKTHYYRENLSVVYTHIAGASISTPAGPLTVGYATTRGVFSNFNGSKVPVFASALLASKLEEIPYLSAGLSTLRSVASTNWIKSAGDTALYARRLQYVGLAPSGVSSGDLGDQTTHRTNFVTQHLEQRGIGDLFDLTVVSTTAPKPNLYEATIGFHTPGYLSPKSAAAAIAAGANVGDAAKSGLAISAGVVRLPDLWFYGVKGGYRFKASATYMITTFANVGLAFNDTDILSVFPYAYNAPQISGMLAGAF